MATGTSCCNECPTVQVTNTPGLTGAAGADGADGADGGNAYGYINEAGASVPAAPGTNLTILITDTAWMTPGQIVVIAGPSHYQVSTVAATGAVLTWLDYPGDVAALTAIANGALISPAGMAGPSAEILAGITPEGVTTAKPGMFAWGTDSSLWIKETGVWTSTGWVKILSLLFFLSTFSLWGAAPPYERNQFSTNKQAAVMTLATNIATQAATSATNAATTNIVISLAPRLIGTNTLSGSNTITGVLTATNVNNLVVGRFIGSGNGFTNMTFTGGTNTAAADPVNIKAWVPYTNVAGDIFRFPLYQ